MDFNKRVFSVGLIFLGLNILFVSACKKEKEDHCPEEITLSKTEFSNEVLDLNPFNEIDEFIYVNEDSDSILFDLDYKNIEVETKQTFNPIECRENPELDVIVTMEAIASGYYYTSSNGDSLNFHYIPSFHFSSNGYSSELSIINFLLLIELKLSHTDEEIIVTRTIREEGTPDLITDDPYEIGGYSYSEYYNFVTIDTSKFVLFEKDHGLIGFTDTNEMSWILVE